MRSKAVRIHIGQTYPSGGSRCAQRDLEARRTTGSGFDPLNDPEYAHDRLRGPGPLNSLRIRR